MKAPSTIGYDTIYAPQQRVAERALGMLLANERGVEHKRSPIIIFPPQGGKTGAMAWLISAFIDDCKRRNRTFQVVAFCGLPHLDLKEQTRRRLTESVRDGGTHFGSRLDIKARQSELLRLPPRPQSEGLVILHNSSKLRSLDLNVPVDVRLWIGDEVHLGNVKDGNIDVMFKNHGVRICEQIHTWDNSKTMNHFVGVSATPSAHMLKSDNIDNLYGETLFRWIYEPPPPEYNSLAMMKANKRLKQTQPLFLPNGRPSDFFGGIYADFLQACKAKGPGHLVIRATGKRHVQLMAHINRRGRGIECREFDSESKNIDELNYYLSTKPLEPTLVVIRGSMRAGITLGLNHYIRGWVETESATADTQAQAGVGRACGYGRTKEDYPIYCDFSRIDAWIETYAALDKLYQAEVAGTSHTISVPIPNGVQNKGLKTHNSYPILDIMDYKPAWEKHVEPYRNNEKKKKTDSTIGSDRYRAQLASTDQVFLDVAGMFLDGGRRDSGSTRGIHLNGPTSKKAVDRYLKSHPKASPEKVRGWARRNRESYKKLVEEFPHAEGRVIVFDIDAMEKAVNSGQSRDGLQKRKSAVKK